MDRKTILCYGDSNTYGYDPRDFLGGQYEKTWCSILETQTGAKVINFGENGRKIPTAEWEYSLLCKAVADASANAIVVMLGTNDILCGAAPEAAARKLSNLLNRLSMDFPACSPVLLAPPQTALPEFSRSMEQLAALCKTIACQKGIAYGNPQEWRLELAFDGVHLREESQFIFAEKLSCLMSDLA